MSLTIINNTTFIISGTVAFPFGSDNFTIPSGERESIFIPCVEDRHTVCQAKVNITSPCPDPVVVSFIYTDNTITTVTVFGTCPTLGPPVVKQIGFLGGVIPVKPFGISLLGPAVRVSVGRRC